ncbi:MarR family transcriptional regulator [[Actinomadura] parvosata subsp. kistnae]|uniref:MarR family transcriptional regulator n=1 Tax=[Actinomadura] parvosata subsp. kistnae TaxID=1909395 RepID=A0A1U9ZVI4_9ACTN|nr:MarR family transcriptional regulator [Nonomuraea sp. ATCC 55076]AQZ61939.1 MarR family transcriptional regulator [Nonomuraea sp. ATCC 55076]
MKDRSPGRMDTEDLQAVISAVLTGSRLLVSIAARSLAAVQDRVTLPQFRMLVVLSVQGETNLVTMADALAVNSSTASRMADRLATAGLIVRETNPHNRRETLMRLTLEGRRLVDDVMTRRSEEIAAIVSRMTPLESQALIAAMTAFNKAGGEPPANLRYPLGWPDR